MEEYLSKSLIKQPISELDSFILNNIKDGDFEVDLPQEQINELMNAMEVPLQPILLVSITEIVRILDTIRNNILKWALQLESEGIIGEGMSFSTKKRIPQAR